MHYTHRPATTSGHAIGLPNIGMFNLHASYGLEDHPRLSLPFPAPFLSISRSSGRRRGIDRAGSAHSRSCPTRRCPPSPLWRQSDHGMDRPILLSVEGACVPPLPLLNNAGLDGFLLCGCPRRRINRLCHRHVGCEAGLRRPHPLLPTTGTPVPVGLILQRTGDGEMEIGRLPRGPQLSSTGGFERPMRHAMDSRQTDHDVGRALSSWGAAECNADGHCFLQTHRTTPQSTDRYRSSSDPLSAMLKKVGDH